MIQLLELFEESLCDRPIERELKECGEEDMYEHERDAMMNEKRVCERELIESLIICE